MPGHALHRRDIGAGVEQIANERPPQIVWRKGLHGRLLRALLERTEHGLVAQPPDRDRASFVDGTEQRAWRSSAHRQPIRDRGRRATVEVGGAVFAALAAAHCDRACLWYIVTQVERD